MRLSRDLCPILPLLPVLLALASSPASAEGTAPAASPAPAVERAPFRVTARLVHLPKSPPCDRKLSRVVTLYSTSRGERLLVVQRCPELARGHARVGKGNAGPLHTGQLHDLLLRPLTPEPEQLLIRTDDGEGGELYEALATDVADPPRPLAVLVSGGGGTNHRLYFEKEEVSVGSRTDSDVLLSDDRVAPRQLAFLVRGDEVRVRDAGSPRRTTVNGEPLGRGASRVLGGRDLVGVGPYLLKVAVLNELPK
jgi:hypothetical protein